MKRILRWRQWWFWGAFPFLLWWLWKDVPLASVWQLLRQLALWQVLALIGLNGALTLLFSLRWWLILAALGYRLPYLKLAAYRLAGFAVSFLTPGPQFGGEPVQVYALARRERIPSAIALASVMLDRLLELLVNLAFLAFGILFVFTQGLLPHQTLAQVWLPVGALLALPSGYLGLLAAKQRPFTTLLGWIGRLGIAPRLLSQALEMIRAAENQAADFCCCRRGLFALVMGASLAVWGLMMLEFWLSFRFLGLALSVQELLFALVAARLAMLLPMPGGMGAVEASQMLAARFLGFNPAYAVGIMLLARGRDLSLAALGLLIALHIPRHASFDPLSNQAGQEITIHSGG